MLKKTNSVSRGKEGEKKAAEALEASGLLIIAKNFRSIYGEVDIIALDGEVVVFVEVKTWSSFGIENLQYGINKKKQDKIIKTAKYFLLENRKYNKMTIRFDVVFVKNNSITHLASAFTERV